MEFLLADGLVLIAETGDSLLERVGRWGREGMEGVWGWVPN